MIDATSETLVRILRAHVDVALPVNSVLVQTATTTTFKELGSTTQPVITVFLYRIAEHTEQRNAPRRRRADGTERRQPLALELFYLVTPWGARPSPSLADDETASQQEHRLLGITLQAFYDHAEIARSELADDENPNNPRIWGDVDSIQLVMESLPVDEMYRIWDASEIGYRLSAAYRARVLGLDATDDPTGPRVLDATFRVEAAR